MKIWAACLLLVLGTHSAMADCFQTYEHKLLTQEKNRARIIAASILVGDLALCPIFPAAGAIIMGGTAVVIGGTTFLMDELNKNATTLPAGLKQYIVINSVLNSGSPIDIEEKADTWLLGKRVKFHYRVPTARQADFMDDFTDSIQQDVSERCFREISEDKLRLAVSDLMQNEQLCKDDKGAEKALSMAKFKTLIALQLCK